MWMGLGWVVSRRIPVSQLPGILQGTHKVYGGVVRNNLGRITAHLLTNGASGFPSSLLPGLDTIGSLVNAAQIYAVGRDVQQVQQSVNAVFQTAVAGTVLSGLGVVTSVAGFAYLSHRLNRVEVTLSLLEKQVKEIKALLQMQQRAQLSTALDNLRYAETTADAQLRRELLRESHRIFTTLSHYYGGVWGHSEDMSEVELVDEYFTLAFTGAALAASALGEWEMAALEFKTHQAVWRSLAKQHSEKHLFKGDPRRLIDSELVEDLPTRELVGMLDFVHSSDRGIDWIDELRRMPSGSAMSLQRVLPGGIQKFVRSTSERNGITFVRRLRARDEVLDANVAHFEFLSEKKISANRFSVEIKEALANSNGEPICITEQSLT